ncbi:ankyrin repeat domain-containing protein [Rheinheimera maricola]|uniref:Ankyrin repeat domain-containing protein n=1 Tax=Rheinheimera maricola TaxID=2793282 RepID=A0ABS7XEE1_9GAMM|nr:hypothetical protein [Rheinheimera maricola]MBZ9613425.1 hypothetical protein [Rheinheimera maricola]
MKLWILFILAYLIPITGCSEGEVTLDDRDYLQYFSEPHEQAVIAAILAEDSGKLKSLAASGVDLNATGKFENTPLRVAIKVAKPDMLETLLTLGANPNFRTSKGVVAAKSAAEDEDPIYINILLESGLDPNLLHDKRPILFYALENERWEQFDALIKAGAEVLTTKTSNNTTIAIMLASMFQYDRLMAHIQAGGDYKTGSKAGVSVLDILADDQKKFGGDPEQDAYQKRGALLHLLRAKGQELPDGIPGVDYPNQQIDTH